jgi:hypothetical protein
VSAAPEPASGVSIPVSVVFSEPVTGFDASALVVTNASVAVFAGAGATYTFNLLPHAPGVVTVALPAAAAADAAGNASLGSNVFSRTYVWAPPALTTPGAVTVEATSPHGAVATFDTAAVDAGGSPTPVTCSPASGSMFPIGATTVRCWSTDRYGNTGVATLTVTVEDTAAPSIATAIPSTASLWPANHKMVRITVAVSASDLADAAPVCSVASVSSNEPGHGLGDGDAAPDWTITGALSLDLRAERAGNGSGRVYTIAIQCADQTGNTSTTTTQVTVAHDQRN